MDYIPIEGQESIKRCDQLLGEPPEGVAPWKFMVRCRTKDEKLQGYFEKLFNEGSLGAKLAKDYKKWVNGACVVRVQLMTSMTPIV